MTEEAPTTNGVKSTDELDDSTTCRPADIEADMKEMDRRKRVDAIMNSRMFREELERIVDNQTKEGPSGILQQLSDMMGIPAARVGSVFKSSNCVVPINDIRGIESMGYAKGEKILRCKLAATFRLIDLHGWTQGMTGLVTARLNADQELFLVNPYGLFYHEMTASALNKVNMQGVMIEQGTTNFGVNQSQFQLHSVIHAARPDLRCAIYLSSSPVMAVSALKNGLLPMTKSSVLVGEVNIHPFTGSVAEPEEKEKLLRSLGPMAKVLLLTNHGAVCCGETIEEAFYTAYHLVQACEAQLKLMPLGLDNISLIPEESRKIIYEASRKAPDMVAVAANGEVNGKGEHEENDKPMVLQQNPPKWRVGGQEFEAAMRMLDNAGFRTGYIYRQPLIKSEIPKPKNDVELPPAVSSLGYLLEEEELYRQGVWKKGDPRVRGDRSKWLNSPNVYQKVEVLETGTPDPRKITKWVADDSPSHSSNAVRIESALQFVPQGTNPKEFKRLQQQIKENRRADLISAGPQSHILEGVTWDEANRIKDGPMSQAGDHVVLMGAASKGIIQRNYQHNAQVYKTAYQKNPFDCVTDDEITEYKRTVARKAHGDNTDTDFSESEALSSLPMSGPPKASAMSPPSMSDSEHHHEVLRIETKTAPKPSQVEVVLSDATAEFLNTERLNSGKGKSPAKGLEEHEEEEEEEEERQDKCRRSFPEGLEWTSTGGSFDSRSTFLQEENSSTTTTTSTTHIARPVSRFRETRRSKSFSPYRSNAFFGFNGASFANPQHFNVPKGNSRFKPLRRSISLEEIFSTHRYLDGGDNKWQDMVATKFLMKRVLSASEDGSATEQENASEVPTNSVVDLTAISEESNSQESKSGDCVIRNVINEAVDRASALVEVRPNNFIEAITQMAYSAESTVGGVQGTVDGSITTSFQSMLLQEKEVKSPPKEYGKLMGRDERDSRKKEFFELWENHVESCMAQDQSVSLEFEVQPMDTTNVLMEQERELQEKLHRISMDLEARRKMFTREMADLGDDLNAQEKLLLEKLEDYNLTKDENSIFYRIEQSILNKDRPASRCMSVESTGTQTTMSTSTPNHSTFGESASDASGRHKNSSTDKSRIPIRSPQPRVLFEQHENVQKKNTGAIAKVAQKPKAAPMTRSTTTTPTRVRGNPSSLFAVYTPTPSKENVHVFQKKGFPSPSLWVTMNDRMAQKRVAESPITPKTAKKPNKISSVTMRRRAAAQRLQTNAPPPTESCVQENRVNTFRDMDLETDKLRGTIDRCTDVISDIGQSVQEMKVSLAEVATAQTELTEEIKALNRSR